MIAIGAKDNNNFDGVLFENTNKYIVMNKIPPLESIKPRTNKPINVILSAVSSKL